MTSDDRIADLLGEWYGRGESGDPEDLIRAHPDLAGELRAGIAAHELLGRARSPAPEPGVSLPRRVGEFQIVREIGRGGMGVVYEADQTSMSRRVALKVLDPAVTAGARGIERFQREAQAAGGLRHPNIVPVFAMGEADGVWYYAMEWQRGATLAETIRELRRMEGDRGSGPQPAAASEPERVDAALPRPGPRHDPIVLAAGAGMHVFCARVAEIFAGVADGLGAAHAAGVIHRDIKPANLLFDEIGTLKVADFGLAQVQGEASRTRTGDLLGTPAYMSPEQALGGGAPLDGRADIYALGATLYELLTLSPPFGGADARQVLARIFREAPPRPRQIRPGIPRDLETIVLHAMEPDPARRYPDAGALAADLRAFASGRRIGARSVRWPARAARSARRHPVMAALTAALAALAVAVVVLAARGPGIAEDRLALGPGLSGSSSADPDDAAWAEEAIRRRRAEADYDPTADPRTRTIGPTWAKLHDLPLGSYGLGGAFLDGTLYALSGYFTPRVAAYDPDLDVWTDVAPLPRPLQFFGTAVMNGRIWVVGGDYGGTGASADLRAFEPRTDQWTTRAPMPGGPRWDVGAAVLGGRLYVVGGRPAGRGTSLARVEAYDPVTDRWEERAPLPTPRALSGGLAALDGKLYAAGGSHGVALLTTLEVYDPSTDTWTARAPMPVPLATQAVVVDDGLLMVGGGTGHAATTVLRYDPKSDAWTEAPPLAWRRRAHAVAYDPTRRRLYAVAGYVDACLSSVEVCSPPSSEPHGEDVPGEAVPVTGTAAR